jgi:hypothetical protein
MGCVFAAKFLLLSKGKYSYEFCPFTTTAVKNSVERNDERRYLGFFIYHLFALKLFL